MDIEALKACSADELDEAITQIHAAQAAVHQSLLELIVAYDESGAWRVNGAHSMAAYLSFRLRVSMGVAHSWVNAARALSLLPAVREAYAQGLINWEHVVALASVATPESEQELLGQALQMPAAHFKTLCRGLIEVSDLDARQAVEQRSLCYGWDPQGRFLHLRGRLPDLDGAVVAKALDRLTNKAGPDPLTGQFSAVDQNNADALVELCSTYLDTAGDQDRATVVVHVDAAVLEGGPGVAQMQGAGVIAAVTARRAACDCVVELVAEDSSGRTVGIGRKSRQVPGWLVRQLRTRDYGCRFPGCSRTRWVHAHHLKHWADGGPTDKENLVLLCGHHHRLVHDGGWSIRGNPDECMQFFHPDGRLLTGQPPPLRAELRESLFAAFAV